MTIIELADRHGLSITILLRKACPEVGKNRFTAYFPDQTDGSEELFLDKPHGLGRTPTAALHALERAIRGTTMLFRVGYQGPTKRVVVPKSLGVARTRLRAVL